MKRVIFLFAVLILASCRQAGYVTISGYAQGGTYSVKLNMDGVALSEQEICEGVDSILQAIDVSLSGYNGNSLLRRFNAGERIVPDSLFVDMYEKAYDVYEQTGGVVDASSAPLFDIWGFGFKRGELPDDDLVAETMSACGMDRLCRDLSALKTGDGTLSGADILRTGETVPPALNYNALAQGYSCDVVAAYLYKIGVRDMMVDIGEIFCDGMNPSGQPWKIGIDRPVDGNNELGSDLQGVFSVPAGPHGVVTSGNYRKFYVRDGKKYAHTIDPRTGRPVKHNLLSATVVAPDAMTADAYATYCMVVGLEESKDFIESHPELEACLVYDADGVFAVWCSSGFELTTL